MQPARTPDTPRDVDLRRTRRTFLFAREQVAAQTTGYVARRRAHQWAAYREHTDDRVIEAAESSAR
jgi:hypothetical protein